jgi:hypothetical protein
MESPRPTGRTLVGIALVCFANLLLEVVLTRIFSATMYYHFTFLAVALALLGMSVSGVYVYIRMSRFSVERAAEDLSTYSRRFALTTIAALLYVLANPVDLGIGGPVLKFTSQTFFQLLFLTVACGLPFFFAGMVVSLAVYHYRDHIARVYAFDLAGAALAALLVGAGLSVLGAPSLVLAIAVLAAVSALLFHRPRAADLAIGGAMVVMLVANLGGDYVRVYSGKGVREDRIVFEGWNAFSRITVEKLKNGDLDIKIDASAATRIIPASNIGSRDWTRDPSAFAHHAFEDGADEVLIVGPGGGVDVVNSLAAGAKKVTAVEINPLIADTVMRDRFRRASGDLYFDPRVKLVVDEGRSFIRRSQQRFDLIQATLVDTWAATASGAFSLTESTLYTVEAFADYYAHLTERGMVTMSRWHTGRDPETARLLVLAAAGLVRAGVPASETRHHLYFVRKDSLGTLIARRTPFTEAELDRFDSAAAAAKFEVVVSPRHAAAANNYQRLVDAGPYSDYVASRPRDLSPPTDDRPFFFYFVKAGDFFSASRDLVNPAMWILIAFGSAIVALAVGFIVVPLLMFRRHVVASGGRARIRLRITALLYFCAIGFGFITLELALMHQLGLFLGHPTYGLVVVLFTILLATALGARLTGLVSRHLRTASIAGAIVVAIGVGYALGLGSLLHDRIAWPLAARVALASAIVAVPGCLMGFLLPLGVSWLARHEPGIIPWGWGLNGAMSVFGTVATTIIAIHAGFSAALMVGALSYLVAIAALFAMGRIAPQRSRARQERDLIPPPEAASRP